MELLHVVRKDVWDAAVAAGEYAPAELQREGFLHCCTAEQLAFVLGRHFVGVTDLLIVSFETDRTPSEVRWVKSEPDQAPFPHLYGPIPMAAIRGAVPPVG
jgi:uncharacterized protein (DUF952 family)